MRHRERELLEAQLAIRQPAVILFPSRFIGELIEVLRANMTMLAHHQVTSPVVV